MPQNKVLYKTNNKYTNILASRYSRHYTDFVFTKSSYITTKKKVYKDKQNNTVTANKYNVYEYTDPINNRLSTPFTATDIYLHKLNNNIYAMDRYNIRRPSELLRLYTMVELSKSLMFSFINIFMNIYNLKAKFDKTLVRININDIYQGLIWATHENQIIFSKQFIITKVLNRREIDRIIIDKYDPPMEYTNEATFTVTPAKEIPYIRNIPIVRDMYKVDTKPETINKVPVNRRLSESIELNGLEQFFYNNIPLANRNLEVLYKEFFDLTREEVEEETPAVAEIVEAAFNTEEMFPTLTATPVVKPQKVLAWGRKETPGPKPKSVEEISVESALQEPNDATTLSADATSAASAAPAPATTTSAAAAAKSSEVTEPLPFSNAIDKINKQISTANSTELPKLRAELARLQRLQDIEIKKKALQARADASVLLAPSSPYASQEELDDFYRRLKKSPIKEKITLMNQRIAILQKELNNPRSDMRTEELQRPLKREIGRLRKDVQELESDKSFVTTVAKQPVAKKPLKPVREINDPLYPELMTPSTKGSKEKYLKYKIKYLNLKKEYESLLNI
jgi:hypothetical protein